MRSSVIFAGLLTLAAQGMITSAPALADTSVIETRIHDIWAPEAQGEAFQVLSEADGRVLNLPVLDAHLAREAFEALARKATVELTVSSDDTITSLRTIIASTVADDLNDLIAPLSDTVADPSAEETLTDIMSGYDPTLVADLNQAKRFFTSLESLSGNTQCYQRAMLWTHSLWSRYGVNSQKVFLFFTKRYIREYRYKWWFHVAPLVQSLNGELVLDHNFTRGPLPTKDWTNIFVYSKQECKEIAHYNDYSNNQEAAHCYVRKVPMFYYQPMDIEKHDNKGVKIPTFRSRDLSHAERARSGGWFWN